MLNRATLGVALALGIIAGLAQLFQWSHLLTFTLGVILGGILFAGVLFYIAALSSVSHTTDIE